MDIEKKIKEIQQEYKEADDVQLPAFIESYIGMADLVWQRLLDRHKKDWISWHRSGCVWKRFALTSIVTKRSIR